jgi:hypothetical protein
VSPPRVIKFQAGAMRVELMYSEPAVAVCIQRPNEVVAEIPLLSVALASDSGHTPDHLGEMP